MKLIQKIKGQFTGLGDSFLRFPVTAILSFTLMGLIIIQNERNIQGIYENETLRRLAMVTAIGMLLSISLKHLHEQFWPEKPSLFIIIPPVAIVMLLYYFLYTENMNMSNGVRFTGTIFLLIVVIFYSLKLKHDDHYEPYVARVFNGLLITVVYSAVLFFGISAIIFTINALFDAGIDQKWYFYIFLMVTFVFGALMFLSKLPRKEENFELYPYSKALKVLLLYIVIPLITIYTGILYVYFIRILITQEWPRGLVSNLVLWYSALSAAVIFFITPILHENPVAKMFRTWFPRIILPILAMMFVSIGIRINQYGITENRYFIVWLGIWVLLVMIYFVIRKELNNIFLPVTLSIFAVVSIFGPLSAFNISNFSQNARFTSILERNNMLESGSVVPGTNVSEDDRQNISSIVQYFESRDQEKLRHLQSDYEYGDFEQTFGFQREGYYGDPGVEYINIFSDHSQYVLEVGGYDYLFTLSSYLKPQPHEGIRMELTDTTVLTIMIRDEVVFQDDLDDEIRILADKYLGQLEKGQLAPEDAVILLSDEVIEIKVMVRELSARKSSNGTLNYDHLMISVLFSLKE